MKKAIYYLIFMIGISFLTVVPAQFPSSDYPYASFEDLTQKAEQGDVNAMFILGGFYYNGASFPNQTLRINPAPVEALKWYIKTAEKKICGDSR